MKKSLLLFTISISLAILFFPTNSNSLSTGSPGGRTGSPADNYSDCTSCHNINSSLVTTTNITSNIPNSGYIPGTIYTITANLNSVSGFGLNGFEITCEENTTNSKTGNFFLTNPIETQFTNNGDAITHTAAGNSLSSWSFNWEAPSAGTGDITFYGAFIEAGYPLGSNSGDYLTLSTLNISEAQIPCNLSASVYIDYNNVPWMLNAILDSNSSGSAVIYEWVDTNGVIVSTSNQSPFYSQWCVTITDLSGCDTTICQDCIADSTAICACPFIYMPVCGCDGFMYPNSCVADCADVPWTPAISNGMPGGFLPCNQPSTCEVEIDGDSIICNWGDSILLEASPTASSSSFISYVWSTGDTGHILSTIANWPGVYSVTATDSSGCTSTESFSIGVENIMIFSNPSPPIICLGDTIVLEFANTPLTNIVWVPTGDTTDIIYDTPLTSTMYIVEGIDFNGCDRRGDIFVTTYICGCMLPAYCNYNASATLDDGSCSGLVGCMDTTACNYDWSASCDPFNACVLPDGCTDPAYCNYDATAQCDDGSCFGVIGCMDPLYVEYNPNALCDPNNDQCITIITTSIADQELDLLIFPNPAGNQFYINFNRLDLYNIEVIDIMGRVVTSREKVNNLITINSSIFSEGTYFIKVKSSSEIKTYKIIINK